MSVATVCRAYTYPHPDPKYTRIQVAEVLGNTVIVSKDVKNAELGVYFDTEAELSKEFCTANKLYKSLGGYIEDSGRVRTLKLAGVKSVGLWLPLTSLSFLGQVALKEGDTFQALKKVPIVKRFIPPSVLAANQRNKKKLNWFKRLLHKYLPRLFAYLYTPKPRVITRGFPQHYDTSKFGAVFHHVEPPFLCVITEKLHGTSARQGRVCSKGQYYDVYGTRKTEKERVSPTKSFNERVGESYRAKWANQFKERLRKNEVIFYEIVGFSPNGKSIMANLPPGAIDKKFAQQYGDSMTFSYGCKIGESKAYLYRIAIVNEDGQEFEMPWSYVQLRAAQIGIPLVPILDSGAFPNLCLDWEEEAKLFIKNVEKLGQGASILDSTHIKEGVVVRMETLYGIRVGKAKSWEFLTMESKAKDKADYTDVEENESFAEAESSDSEVIE